MPENRPHLASLGWHALMRAVEGALVCVAAHRASEVGMFGVAEDEPGVARVVNRIAQFTSPTANRFADVSTGGVAVLSDGCRIVVMPSFKCNITLLDAR